MKDKPFYFMEVALGIALLALAGSFLLPRLFEFNLKKNESSAQVNIKTIILPALENYAKDHNGTYPASFSQLLEGSPAYLTFNYTDKIIQGYLYEFSLAENGYTVLARPYRCGYSGNGRKTYILKTGGNLEEVDCTSHSK